MAEKNEGAASGTPAKKKPPVAPKAPTKAANSAEGANARPPKKATSTKATSAPATSGAAPKKSASTTANATVSTAKKPETSKSAAAKADSPKTVANETVSDTATRSTPKSPSKAEKTKRESVLKVHHLRPAPGSKKERTRVGRGEGSKGKTAGRGTKGTKARYSVRPGFEGGNLNSVMRAPKLRGFTNPFRVEYQVVNLNKLAELYPSGGAVTVGDLVGKGVVRANEKVKVLGNGDIAVKLNVAVDKVSSSAEKKIVAAGGSVQ